MPGRRLLLSNAVVHTLDPRRPAAGAVLVEGEQIAAVLQAGETVAGADRVDLGGRCVVPGFTDAHAHFPTWALTRSELRLEDTGSLAEVLARAGDAAAAAPTGRWVRGFGWTQETWQGGGEPTREALDAVTGDVPVALLAHDWHSLWLNSAALARAGGDLEAPGGVVERDAAGMPTGVLREAAAWRFRDEHAGASHAELLEATRAALPAAAAQGVTAIHDKDGVVGALEVFRALRGEGALSLRVWQSLPLARLAELVADGVTPGTGDAWLRLGYLKAFLDGTLGSRTARLLAPDGTAQEGVEVTTAAAFTAQVRAAAQAGFPVAVHAIGDLAVRDALDAYAATADAWRPRGLRQRIEHAQCVTAADRPRLAALGITASVQPAMATTDRDVAERLWADRLEGAYAYRSLHAAGVRLAFGSDAPIEALVPLDAIRAAVLRTDGERPPWRPHEALDAETALAASTVAPAWLAGEEGVRGRLAPGLLADLVVLSHDPLAGSDALAAASVEATMVGGRWTHGR